MVNTSTLFGVQEEAAEAAEDENVKSVMSKRRRNCSTRGAWYYGGT